MDKKISFEELLKELQLISNKLENPAIELNEAINLYKNGIELSKKCKELLENAKEQINIEK